MLRSVLSLAYSDDDFLLSADFEDFWEVAYESRA